jgi:uncharacterized paraquat-inducible protein A
LATPIEAVVAIWILLPLRPGSAVQRSAMLLRPLQAVRPWVMVEAFMRGELVATVKLSSMTAIEPGMGSWAFAVTMATIAGLGQSLVIQIIWQVLRTSAPLPRPRPTR